MSEVRLTQRGDSANNTLGHYWRAIEAMRAIRYVQIALLAYVSLIGLLAGFNNITDYGSNFAFVQHVMSMDTTFPGNAGMYRALNTPWMHHVCYWIIITAQALFGIVTLAGAVRLYAVRQADAEAFHRAKTLAFIGLGIGLTLYILGFMVVGAEWFLMWQSPKWDGRQAAIRIIACMGFALLFLAHKE
jgi:predicted small integral membrane protein